MATPEEITRVTSVQDKIPERASPEIQFSELELDAIASVIFKPEEGAINEAVKFYTGQKKLEGYQRVLLAPANAFEGLISFGIDFFTGKAEKDIASFVLTLADADARKMLMDLLKKGWENCTKTEKTAFVTELISSMLVGVGTISKLKKIIPSSKLAALEKYSAARKLQALAGAIIASPLDEITAASAPVFEQTSDLRGKMKN